jgi:hypothetical protein
MSNYYLLDRIAGRDPEIRAADADRERIAERLRNSHAEGRLDLSEFQERLERCYDAKTMGELDVLVKDLPREDGPDDGRAVGRRHRPMGWRLAPLMPLLLALIVVAAAAGQHAFWLWIPLAFLLFRITWWRRRRWAPGAWSGPRDRV